MVLSPSRQTHLPSSLSFSPSLSFSQNLSQRLFYEVYFPVYIQPSPKSSFLFQISLIYLYLNILWISLFLSISRSIQVLSLNIQAVQYLGNFPPLPNLSPHSPSPSTVWSLSFSFQQAFLPFHSFLPSPGGEGREGC